MLQLWTITMHFNPVGKIAEKAVCRSVFCFIYKHNGYNHIKAQFM